jgi:antitoxin YefM
MILANFSEFRSNLKNYLDKIENNNEILFLKRSAGKGSVVMSLEEYNSIMETLHILKSRKTTERLFESIEQINSGEVVIKTDLEN